MTFYERGGPDCATAKPTDYLKLAVGKAGYQLTEERESVEVIPDDNDGFITAVAEAKVVASANVVAIVVTSLQSAASYNANPCR